MPPVDTGVFTVFVRVLVVCKSLPTKHCRCIGETTISVGAWLAVIYTLGRTDVAHACDVALVGVQQLNQAQLLTPSPPSSPSLTTVHVPIALLLDRVGKVKLVATEHDRLALSRC
jgi:hypothetical protein